MQEHRSIFPALMLSALLGVAALGFFGNPVEKRPPVYVDHSAITATYQPEVDHVSMKTDTILSTGFRLQSRLRIEPTAHTGLRERQIRVLAERAPAEANDTLITCHFKEKKLLSNTSLNAMAMVEHPDFRFWSSARLQELEVDMLASDENNLVLGISFGRDKQVIGQRFRMTISREGEVVMEKV